MKCVIAGQRASGRTSFASFLEKNRDTQNDCILMDDLVNKEDIESNPCILEKLKETTDPDGFVLLENEKENQDDKDESESHLNAPDLSLVNPANIQRILQDRKQDFIFIVQRLENVPVYVRKTVDTLVIMQTTSPRELQSICKLITKIAHYANPCDVHPVFDQTKKIELFIEFQFRFAFNQSKDFLVQAVVLNLKTAQLIHYTSNDVALPPEMDSKANPLDKLNEHCYSWIKRATVELDDGIELGEVCEPMKQTKRFWVSWYTTKGEDHAAPKLDFPTWLSGQGSGEADDDEDDEEWSIVADIQAINEEDVWRKVRQAYPNHKQRFCRQVPADYNRGDRFL